MARPCDRALPTKELAICAEPLNLDTNLAELMKLKSLLTLAALFAISFNLALAAEDDTELAKEMKAMNKSLRTLKKQIADPSKKEESLKLLTDIRKHVAASHQLDPAKTKDIPAAEKAAYLDKYKKQLDDLDKSYEEVEAAIKADKPDDAKKAFEKLSEQKEKGHKDFGVDDDK